MLIIAKTQQDFCLPVDIISPIVEGYVRERILLTRNKTHATYHINILGEYFLYTDFDS